MPVPYQHLPSWAYNVLNTEVDTGLEAYHLCVALEFSGKLPDEVQNIFDDYYHDFFQQIDAVYVELHFAMAYYLWEVGTWNNNSILASKLEQFVAENTDALTLQQLGASKEYLEKRQNHVDIFLQHLKNTQAELPAKRSDELVKLISHYPLQSVYNQIVAQQSHQLHYPSQTIVASPSLPLGELRPTLLLHNGITTNLVPSNKKKGKTIWIAHLQAQDFVLSHSTNHLQQDYRIEKNVQLHNAPTPPNTTQITFNELEVGIQTVRIWTSDEHQHWTFADTYALIQMPEMPLPPAKQLQPIPQLILYHGLVTTLAFDQQHQQLRVCIKAADFIKSTTIENYHYQIKCLDVPSVPPAETLNFEPQSAGTNSINVVVLNNNDEPIMYLNTYLLIQNSLQEGVFEALKQHLPLADLYPNQNLLLYNGIAMSHFNATSYQLSINDFISPKYAQQIATAHFAANNKTTYELNPTQNGVLTIKIVLQDIRNKWHLIESYVLLQS